NLSGARDIPAYRAEIANPRAQAIVRAIETATGNPVIQVVSLGGSIPHVLVSGKNHIPVIGVPIANHDNNQHAANENLRLQNLWDAVQVYVAIFTEFDGPRAPRSAAAH